MLYSVAVVNGQVSLIVLLGVFDTLCYYIQNAHYAVIRNTFFENKYNKPGTAWAKFYVG